METWILITAWSLPACAPPQNLILEVAKWHTKAMPLGMQAPLTLSLGASVVGHLSQECVLPACARGLTLPGFVSWCRFSVRI